MRDLAIQAESLAGRGEKGGVDAVIQSLGEAVIMAVYWGQLLCRGWLDCGSRSGGRVAFFHDDHPGPSTSF
jgi:hypothetical protein